jgi:hypothetical protein
MNYIRAAHAGGATDRDHSLIWIASLWAITFLGSTWALALLFRRVLPEVPAPALEAQYANAY